jgi:hypothetical protein
LQDEMDLIKTTVTLDAGIEDPNAHHRQGKAGDHRRKLCREVIEELSGHFSEFLDFFGYSSRGLRRASLADRSTDTRRPEGASSRDSVLQRNFTVLARENGLRIAEIAELRALLTLMSERRPSEP